VPDAERVHTPAGLDIGARTPQEIALSILAQLVETRRSRLAPPPLAAEEHAHHCHE
jgi:xanthine dehydrogenase accessory factor